MSSICLYLYAGTQEKSNSVLIYLRFPPSPGSQCHWECPRTKRLTHPVNQLLLPIGLYCRRNTLEIWRHRELLKHARTCCVMNLVFVVLQWWSGCVFACTPYGAPHWRIAAKRVAIPYKEVVGVAWCVTSQRWSLIRSHGPRILCAFQTFSLPNCINCTFILNKIGITIYSFIFIPSAR